MIRMLALAATLAWTTAAAAQTLYAPTNFIPGASVPEVPMAEWEIEQTGAAEQTGARILIAAGEEELKAAPPKAARYGSKTYTFPSGDVRVLTFTKAKGGVLHQITSETTLVVLKGSAEVGVAGVPTKIAAGDVVSYPSGVLRSQKGKVEDTTVLLYTVGSTQAAPKAKLVRRSDTPEGAGPAGGPGSVKISVRRAALDGNSIRQVRVKGPGRSPDATPRHDVLVYVTSGTGELTVGNETKTVSAGDAIREEGGKVTYWNVPGELTFVATDAPAPAPGARDGVPGGQLK
jgi:quercetin dioxygenase-like cupin family protein